MPGFVQDIDKGGRASSLPQHGERLERREETADLSARTTGVFSASHPAGHAGSSRNHQQLSEGSRHRGMATRWMVTTVAGKTGHASDHRPGKTGHTGDHRVWRRVERLGGGETP